MNKLRIILAFAILLAFTACSGGNKNQKVEKVTTNFLNALVQKDFSTAKKYGSPKVQNVVASLEKDAQKNKEQGKEIKYQILEKQVNDSVGSVRVKITDGDQSREEYIQLKQVDGEWKIAADPKQNPSLRFAAYGKNDPMVVAEEKMVLFFEALEAQDFQTARQYVTPATRPILNMVMNESKTYKKWNDQVIKIKYEIIERVYVNNTCKFKIKIIINEKVREEYFEVVPSNNTWLVVLPQSCITSLRFVVFYARYESIIVIYREYISKHYVKKSKKYTKKHSYKHTRKR